MPSTVLITGSSRGLGYATAREILRRRPDWHVVAAVRGNAEATAERVAAETGNRNVLGLPCDLASLNSVRAAATGLVSLLENGALPPLRGITANAAVQAATATQHTTDGFEMTFGTNILGHFLLITLLQECLAVPGRVVLVSSGTHFGDFQHTLGMVPPPRTASIDELAYPWKTPDASSSKAGRSAYATSKLAAVHLVHELARRLPAGIDAYAFDPGLMPGTGLAREGGPFERAAWHTVVHLARLLPGASSPAASGRALAELVVGPKPADSGSWIELRGPASSSPASYDPERELELWERATALVGLLRDS